MKRIQLIATAIVLLFAATSQAQLTFGGPSVYGGETTISSFTSVPFPTIGSPSSGISLTGVYHINAIAPTFGGNLLSWYVTRPITGGTSSFNITTNYVGNVNLSGEFISNIGAGILRTEIISSSGSYPIADVTAPFSGAATPISSATTVSVTGYTFTPGDFLRLSYISQVGYTGSGGVFDVDFPAESIISPIPEPASAMLILAGLGSLGLRRRRN